jgi:hypothetical protein
MASFSVSLYYTFFPKTRTAPSVHKLGYERDNLGIAIQIVAETIFSLSRKVRTGHVPHKISYLIGTVESFFVVNWSWREA